MAERERKRQFRFTDGHRTGETITLRVIDTGCGWVDVVQGGGDPYCLDPNHPDYASTNVIARARRFYKTEGSAFTGWIVENGRDNSDSIHGKPAALEELFLEVEDLLNGEFL